MPSSVRDPGKLFSNAKQVVEDSVKRSDVALCLARDGPMTFSRDPLHAERVKNRYHSREYSGIPRKVEIDPEMNQDLRIGGSDISLRTHEYLRREQFVCLSG